MAAAGRISGETVMRKLALAFLMAVTALALTSVAALADAGGGCCYT